MAIYAAAAIAAAMISSLIFSATGRGDATVAITLTFLAIFLTAALGIATMARPIMRLLSPTYLAAAYVIPCVFTLVYGAIMVAASSFATIDEPLNDWRWTVWLRSFVCLAPSLAVTFASVSARVNFARPRRHFAVLVGVAVVLLASTAAAVLGVLAWTPRAG
ncbi:hypothetical protein ACIQLK_01870 [Microbacterium sp. NPDC091382]|uniref:hypothetical protein n=1 Tax=Microbacterium sp. NPDC091382 TaxID=3364210 RepID=UPI00382AFFE2